MKKKTSSNIKQKNNISQNKLNHKKIDTKNGPEAGEHNFYRGGNLKIYDNEVQESLKLLKDILMPNIVNHLIDLKYIKNLSSINDFTYSSSPFFN